MNNFQQTTGLHTLTHRATEAQSFIYEYLNRVVGEIITKQKEVES